MQELIIKAHKAAKSHFKKGVAEFIRQNPEYDGLAIHLNPVVTRKAAPGSGKVVIRLFERLLWVGGPAKTQAQLIKDIQPQFASYEIPQSVWQRPLQDYDWATILKHQAGTDKAGISLKGCKTLSDIKKRLLSHSEKQSGTETFKGTIAFSKDRMTINNSVYAMQTSKSKGREYRKVRVVIDGDRITVNADALVALLRASK